MADLSHVRFGVLGTGRITRRLVADLQSVEAVRVTAIASRTAERARWSADAFGIEHAVAGYEALLARDDIDAVYVALPPSLHAEWTVRAMEAGKHGLCEKPLVTSLDEMNAIANAATRTDKRWLDATAWLHHERTDAFAKWIAEAEQPIARDDSDGPIDDRAQSNLFRLGPIRHISTAVSFLNPFLLDDHRLHASLGGGCLLDLGWYAGGAIVWATGALPESLHADVVMQGDVPFRVSAAMRFASGVTATMSCGFDTATRKWMEIAGAEASIVCDDFTRPWADKPARCWVHEASGKVQSFEFGGAQERVMIRRFVEAIQTDNASKLASYQDQAMRTQRLLAQLTESATANR